MTSVDLSPHRATRSRANTTRSARHTLRDATSCQVTSLPNRRAEERVLPLRRVHPSGIL